MKVEIRIPQQGQTAETVVINNWYVNVGDEVKKDDILCQTESNKAVLDVESPVDGKVEAILAEEGEEVEIGKIVAIIETMD